MKTLINIYSAVIGRIKFLNDRGLSEQLKGWETEHKSLAYFIKRSIITDNLFGVDIMEEATEIARLRLFLALVASAQTVDQLEPLPNIDFNILAGNSLIGLIRVDAGRFDASKGEFGGQVDLFRKSYREILANKNRSVESYRHTASWAGDMDLSSLKNNIERQRQEAQATLNDLLLDEWDRAGIRFEQATWDGAKGKVGKVQKRKLKIEDLAALHPFHWGFEFDEILHQRGGFDAIITNPPWEILKPNAKEFFQDHSDLVSKNKMTIEDFQKEQTRLLKDTEIRLAWIKYLSRFPHVSAWFRTAPQFKHQSALVNGKKTGSDLNLYKLFTEQCANLLREGGGCGIVMPSGIYTDLGAKGLRDLLFDTCQVTVIFGLSNEKFIFEEVHHAFKFCLLAFEKGGRTRAFEAGFRISPREAVAPESLGGFLYSPSVHLDYSVDLIDRASPDSRSVMEYKSAMDIRITEKMIKFPLLGRKIDSTWNLRLSNEFHMTSDGKDHFLTKMEPGAVPVYEGKMIHQFRTDLLPPRYWVTPDSVRIVVGQPIEKMSYRFVHRSIARNTDSRTMIGAVLPPRAVFGHSLNGSGTSIEAKYLPYLTAVLNSCVYDYFLRQQVTANLTMFFVYQSPVPRLILNDQLFSAITHRSAKLICTTSEFSNLAEMVGVNCTRDATNNPIERGRLRAELDGLIAHLYGLTEAEFAHVLSTFPLIPEPVKVAALNAYRDVERGLIQ